MSDKTNEIPEGYITAQEAEQILGIDADSVTRAISRGKIKGAYKTQATVFIPAQISKRTIFVMPRESVEEYRKTRERGHTKAEKAAKKQKEQIE